MNGQTTTIRVLIVDDQQLIRSALRALLSEADDIVVVGEAADGVDAVAQTAKLVPDVALMDVRMPRMDGIEATRRIKESTPSVEVVVLTTFDEDEYAIEATRAGAAGFLLKDGDAGELIRGVRLAARGEALIAPTTLRRLMSKVATVEGIDHAAQRAISTLTPREIEVLRCAAAGSSNAEIARELVITEATAKTHISSILTKLGVRDRVQAVVLAHRSGLLDRGWGPEAEMRH